MGKSKEIPAEMTGRPRLQVLICTYGHQGLLRLAAASHPEMEGVEYLISYQKTDNDVDFPLPKELERKDFRIITSYTKGLSANRNIALSRASAPLLLISDDDVDYSEEGLMAVIDTFRRHEEADVIAFRYASVSYKKHYPPEAYDLSYPQKGHYVASIEIALRNDPIKRRIWFNENFGIGAKFPSGEEDIFLRDCLDAGLKAIYEPVTIACHDGPTTSRRNLMLSSRPLTKGAVFLRLHPISWPLRMTAHAIREFSLWRKGLVPSPLSFCHNWIKGARMAKKLNVFPTPDYSYKFTGHE